MFTFVLIIHIIVSLLLMAVILLQDGKGGDIVSTMGGGGSNTVFGSTGATSFLTKGTITLTIIFVVTSLSLAILKTKEKKSLLDTVNPTVETSAPAVTVTPSEKKEGNTGNKAEVKDNVKENINKDNTKTTEKKEVTNQEKKKEVPEKK